MTVQQITLEFVITDEGHDFAHLNHAIDTVANKLKEQFPSNKVDFYLKDTRSKNVKAEEYKIEDFAELFKLLQTTSKRSLDFLALIGLDIECSLTKDWEKLSTIELKDVVTADLLNKIKDLDALNKRLSNVFSTLDDLHTITVKAQDELTETLEYLSVKSE